MANMRTMSFDAVIVGGGGSGMRAALQLAQSGYKTAVITKVFPQDHILYPLKAASLALLLVMIQMINGSGICMTL